MLRPFNTGVVYERLSDDQLEAIERAVLAEQALKVTCKTCPAPVVRGNPYCTQCMKQLLGF